MLIRCTFIVVGVSANDGTAVTVDKALAITMILLFIFVVYGYSMFMMGDLSPQNGRNCAYVGFPNCFTLFNVYRPVVAVMSVNDMRNYAIIPTAIFFILLIALLIRFPLISWKYNKFSQGFFCIILWSILCRFL